MLSDIIALVATASSATVAVVIALQNRRLQERLAVANEVYRQVSLIRDERREAYTHFLAALDAFNRALMAAAFAARDDEMEDGSPSPGDKLRDATQELWFRFLALVLVSGAEVRDAATQATDQMRTSSNAG